MLAIFSAADEIIHFVIRLEKRTMPVLRNVVSPECLHCSVGKAMVRRPRFVLGSLIRIQLRVSSNAEFQNGIFEIQVLPAEPSISPRRKPARTARKIGM